MTSNNKYIVWFDLETTGLDFKRDRIVQIGMIKTDLDGNIVGAVEQLVNPGGVKSTEEALRKHGITDEELVKYPEFPAIAGKVVEYLEGCDLGGHNCARFDIPFLMAEIERSGLDFTIERRRIIDTAIMDKHYNKRKLEDVYKDYCPDGTVFKMAHNALYDTKMCIDIYTAMVDRYKPTREEIDEINCNKSRIDAAGFFVFNSDMQVCMGRGKYMGKRVEEVDPTYFQWMMKSDFPKETVNLANRCLGYVLKQTHQKK